MCCVAGIEVETLQAAHDSLEQLLSSRTAPVVFGLALFLTSQLSTFTGTISGQVVLQARNQIMSEGTERSHPLLGIFKQGDQSMAA